MSESIDISQELTITRKDDGTVTWSGSPYFKTPGRVEEEIDLRIKRALERAERLQMAKRWLAGYEVR